MSGKPGRSGRPSLYTPQLADEICERLAKGESLRSICSDRYMPPESTVRVWVKNEAIDFGAQYAIARSIGYEQMAEELIAISDADYRLANDSGVDGAAVAQARLMSDNRKWLLSKMLPKIYGDRVTQELVGDGERPIVTRIELVPISPRRPALEGPDDD